MSACRAAGDRQIRLCGPRRHSVFLDARQVPLPFTVIRQREALSLVSYWSGKHDPAVILGPLEEDFGDEVPEL